MSEIIPKNKEQEDAIAAGINFIENGDPSEFFMIVGKAGTGKTTIAQAILKPYIKKKNILICALSHKAKLVIADKIRLAYGKDSVVSKSVAGALGMQMDLETGHFTTGSYETEIPAIKIANIIVVDEGSMINEESHALIMSEKKKKAKVIYLGDIRQLPPIRENSSPDEGKPSPSFYSKNRVVLHERIRQGEESPILPFADFFGDNSRLDHPKAKPVPSDCRKNTVNEKGALVFAKNIDEVLDAVLPLYRYAVDNSKMDIIKTVTYRNDTRGYINSMVRSYLFGENVIAQFVENDLLMFQDNYSVDGIDEPISNSFECQVNKVESLTEDYKLWRLHFIYEAKPLSMLVLDETEIKRHADDASKLFAIAKRLSYGQDRTEALAKAWGLLKKFAPVDYAYAITSHKAQGSTYNTVIVDERDIISVSLISNKAKSQSIYTALTRASTTCIVIDGQPADETLQSAVELSNKILNAPTT